jgi:site-specific DNA-cytosine methylase
MRILIACEFSGIVRDAFAARGHDAWSCDLLPTESEQTQKEGKHIQGDVLKILNDGWDMMIAHPPCTHLAVSGARWFHRKEKEQADALNFVRALLAAPVGRICLENPVSVISTRIRKPDQIIHPWQFGHTEQKTTCLWLKNLPKLVETKNVKQEMLKLPKSKREKNHYCPPGPDRWKIRSRTYTGIALAMAEQWGII